jgi:hypothetical protein
MTEVLTVRVPPDLLSRAEARAGRLGVDRAAYVRGLIEEDLGREARSAEHRFGSEDLAGYYTGTGEAATNAVVRKNLRRRNSAESERHR